MVWTTRWSLFYFRFEYSRVPSLLFHFGLSTSRRTTDTHYTPPIFLPFSGESRAPRRTPGTCHPPQVEALVNPPTTNFLQRISPTFCPIGSTRSVLEVTPPSNSSRLDFRKGLVSGSYTGTFSVHVLRSIQHGKPSVS